MNSPCAAASSPEVHPSVAAFLLTLDKFGMDHSATRLAYSRLSPTQKVLMKMSMQKAMKANQEKARAEAAERKSNIQRAMDARCETCAKCRATCKARVSIKQKDGEVVVDCDAIELVDRMRNLCDTCQLALPSCPTKGIAFGDGVGKDNVIRCESHLVREE